MDWTPGGRSPNLEDRRSGGGGIGRGLGIGGTVVEAISWKADRCRFSSVNT